jgi:lipopolysaccharide cholinephosphotransferase
MSTNLQIAQKKMTNMLNTFHNICCKYNLKYWCLGGTLVGAVRHSGFVPWDGDVDVAMLLDDYNILKKHLQAELPSTMYFFDENCTGSFPGLTKIRDLYSSYIDTSNKYNVYNNDNKLHGLQLDIFTYNLKDINGIKHVESIAEMLIDYKENLYKYDDIFPVKITKFHDIDVFIPNEIETFCKHSYGGYIPPFPPIEKQICHEGRIDPINPASYYPIIFKDIYKMKTQQWFSETANKDNILLHHMSGWNYLNQEEWDNLCNHFLDDIQLDKVDNLFDAGCGTGALFKYLNNKNKDIKLFGCDINKNVVNKCVKLFPNANITLNDITNLNDYYSRMFDNVLCVSTISYLYSLEEVTSAVKELLRITKSNGKVHICILCDDNKGLKSFNILIPKSFWCKEKLNVSEIKILDIPLSKFENRYSVFIRK